MSNLPGLSKASSRFVGSSAQASKSMPELSVVPSSSLRIVDSILPSTPDVPSEFSSTQSFKQFRRCYVICNAAYLSFSPRCRSDP